MPFYDFMCNDGHRTEKQFSFKEYELQFENKEKEKVVNCEKCRKVATRTYDATGFQMNYEGGQRH